MFSHFYVCLVDGVPNPATTSSCSKKWSWWAISSKQNEMGKIASFSVKGSRNPWRWVEEFGTIHFIHSHTYVSAYTIFSTTIKPERTCMQHVGLLCTILHLRIFLICSIVVSLINMPNLRIERAHRTESIHRGCGLARKSHTFTRILFKREDWFASKKWLFVEIAL